MRVTRLIDAPIITSGLHPRSISDLRARLGRPLRSGNTTSTSLTTKGATSVWLMRMI